MFGKMENKVKESIIHYELITILGYEKYSIFFPCFYSFIMYPAWFR